jgi:hypothetical protein
MELSPNAKRWLKVREYLNDPAYAAAASERRDRAAAASAAKRRALSEKRMHQATDLLDMGFTIHQVAADLEVSIHGLEITARRYGFLEVQRLAQHAISDMRRERGDWRKKAA